MRARTTFGIELVTNFSVETPAEPLGEAAAEGRLPTAVWADEDDERLSVQ